MIVGSHQVRMLMYASGAQYTREATIANGSVATNVRIDLLVTSPLLLNTCFPHLFFNDLRTILVIVLR